MIKSLLDYVAGTWPTEIEAITRAVQLAMPVIVVCLFVWLTAKAGQWLIDWWTKPLQAPMRTADAEQAKRDVKELLWRGAQGFENTYPVEPPPTDRPRRRAGPPVIVPFPQPDAEVRNPRHLRRQP